MSLRNVANGRRLSGSLKVAKLNRCSLFTLNPKPLFSTFCTFYNATFVNGVKRGMITNYCGHTFCNCALQTKGNLTKLYRYNNMILLFSELYMHNRYSFLSMFQMLLIQGVKWNRAKFNSEKNSNLCISRKCIAFYVLNHSPK